jgi:hypothetical protein
MWLRPPPPPGGGAGGGGGWYSSHPQTLKKVSVSEQKYIRKGLTGAPTHNPESTRCDKMGRRRTRTRRVHYCMSVTVFRRRPIFVTGCDLELLWHIVREIRMEIILTGSRVPQSDPFISGLSQSTTAISTPLLHPQPSLLPTSHMAETQESIWNHTWISVQRGGLLQNNRHVPEATSYKCWTYAASQDIYQTFINLFLLFYNELLCCKAKQ